MIWFVDLPNLTSITSKWVSFFNPRVVTLASISEYWILIVFRYSKSSKCQPTSFIPVCSIEINFEYSLIDLIWFLDVSSILADRVQIKPVPVVPEEEAVSVLVPVPARAPICVTIWKQKKSVILTLDLHSSLLFIEVNGHRTINASFVSLFHTPCHHSLVIHWYKVQTSIDLFPSLPT